MKKVFVAMALLVAGITTASAVDYTARVVISAGSSKVTLREAATLSPARESDSDIPSYNENGIFVKASLDGFEKWAQWGSNDISNVQLEVVQAAAADVTLTFSNVIGTGLKLNVNGTDVDVVDGGSVTLLAADFANVSGKFVYSKALAIKKVTAPSICFNYNVLEINGHAGEALKIAQGATVIDQQTSIGATYSKDLSTYTGRIVVTLGTKEYQIDANPSVTVKP